VAEAAASFKPSKQESGAEWVVRVEDELGTTRAMGAPLRFSAWGAQPRSCGHRDLVLVDEAAEKVASVHAAQWRRRVASAHRDAEWVGRLEVERAVRPSVVVMAHVDAEDVLEVAAAGD
jgi:hypothetical protein